MTNRRDPIGGLPPIQQTPAFATTLSELELFSKQEIADALACERWQISRDCQTLWGEENNYQPLTKAQGWMLYCIACFRRIQYQVLNRERICTEALVDFAQWPEPQIIQLVEAAGGSRQDFDTRIERITLQRRIKRIA